MTDSNRAGFSNRLDLDRFFFEVRDQIYVIMKLHDDFPNYYKGSDIDVFCYDKNKFAKRILGVGNRYLDEGFEIKVADRDELHTFVDFCLDGEIEFRFDLYQSLPNYKKIQLKEHYIYSIIENARVLYREFDGVQYPIYVPSAVDELLLRYVEYIEWYETRPDKVKHLNYILDAVASDPSRIGFLDKLHLYTEIPDAYSSGSTWRDRSCVFNWTTYWIRRIRSVPPSRLPGALVRKLSRIGLALPRKLFRAFKSWRRNRAED